MSEPDITVAIEGLRKRFDAPDGKPFDAIDDISLTVRAGELTAFVGPDGAGKTTLMRMMAGLLRPDEGSLNVLGIDVRADPQSVQNRISYMPQRFGLYEDLSVQENLDLYADLHGVPQEVRRERFGRMLEMTDMARFTDRPAGKLSGGMKQKLGLACTLVRSPDLLLLDEPSVGVDPLSRRDLWKIIDQLIADEQLSVIVSTAYMDEAERCGQIFVFHHGRILADGPPDALRKRAEGLGYVADALPDRPARVLQARLIDAPDRIIDAVPKGGDVHFIRRPQCDEAALADLLSDTRVQPRDAELEDAFMLLLREHENEPAQAADDANTNKEDGDRYGTAETASPSAGERDGPVIVVRDLVRKFGDFTAVASTSFDVQRGEIFGLLGPNGAGKTTTFRMLCGLLPATSGHLEVAGVDLRTARAKARARIGYVSQKFALYGNLSVRENLEFFAGAYGLRGERKRERVKAVIAQFDLDASAQSGILPVGYKQRLAMAAGLLHEPDILFLDEPTSGIDPLARRAFWRTITSLAQGGVTIIITTHFMEEAEYCDRIAIQDAGELLALGTPAEVREQAGDDASDMNEAFIAIVEQNRARQTNEKVAA
ncbi:MULTISPECIES: ATP-binding cassette domain-containing protein [Sphingobium]|uniref:Phosphonate-transporting ATPase., Sulfate-transporting ATPase n=3 Tax=Sphingobium TaxID=165695 RepID=F6F0G1_SPHCR|nr:MULTISPECIES: ATP-binding cassette domain-containing protein [Sphingobium]ARR56467.1 ABC transporter ATP-binding protein [Rhizorhabdus wittichii DC-6]AEG48546.1 Phosphonate-transporting ATPase., Sulfate-transporting ATPase [Sphingobium chlorophenolicum L-1]AMK18013.1 phosphonate-transporting ATPase [Sphingobium sp. MI1205]KEQ55677.1 Phosphonate-transporting ATPase, Sulfate-transporting ATPase [Sphingobium chlorophenolicum]UZW56184.1 ATP-binding cassette domain-containing protein [Sphingobiu